MSINRHSASDNDTEPETDSDARSSPPKIQSPSTHSSTSVVPDSVPSCSYSTDNSLVSLSELSSNGSKSYVDQLVINEGPERKIARKKPPISQSYCDNKENADTKALLQNEWRKREHESDSSDQSTPIRSSDSGSVSEDSESTATPVSDGPDGPFAPADEQHPLQQQPIAEPTNCNAILDAMHGARFGVKVAPKCNTVPIAQHMRLQSKRERRADRQARREARIAKLKKLKTGKDTDVKTSSKENIFLRDRIIVAAADVDLGTPPGPQSIARHPLLCNAFGRQTHAYPTQASIRSGSISCNYSRLLALPCWVQPVPFFGVRYQSFGSPPTTPIEEEPAKRLSLALAVDVETQKFKKLLGNEPSVQAELFADILKLKETGCKIEARANLKGCSETGALASLHLKHPINDVDGTPLPKAVLYAFKPETWKDLPEHLWNKVYDQLNPDERMLLRSRPADHLMERMLKAAVYRVRGQLLALRLSRRDTALDRIRFEASFPTNKLDMARNAPNPCLVINDNLCFPMHMRQMGTQTVLNDYTDLRVLHLDTSSYEDVGFVTQVIPRLVYHMMEKELSLESLKFKGQLNALRATIPLFEHCRNTLRVVEIKLTAMNELEQQHELYDALFTAIGSLTALRDLILTSRIIIHGFNVKQMIMDCLINAHQLDSFECNCLRSDPEDAADLVLFNPRLKSLNMIQGTHDVMAEIGEFLQEPQVEHVAADHIEPLEGAELGGEDELHQNADEADQMPHLNVEQPANQSFNSSNDSLQGEDGNEGQIDLEDQEQGHDLVLFDDANPEVDEMENGEVGANVEVGNDPEEEALIENDNEVEQDPAAEPAEPEAAEPEAAEPEAAEPEAPEPTPQLVMLNRLTNSTHIILLRDVHVPICTTLASQFVEIFPYLERITILSRSVTRAAEMLRDVLAILNAEARNNDRRCLVIRLVHHGFAYESLREVLLALRGRCNTINWHSDYASGAVDVFVVKWWSQCKFYVSHERAHITVLLCSAIRAEPEFREAAEMDQSMQSMVEIVPAAQLPHNNIPEDFEHQVQLDDEAMAVDGHDQQQPINDGINVGPLEDGNDQVGEPVALEDMEAWDPEVDGEWFYEPHAEVEEDMFQALLNNDPIALGVNMDQELVPVLPDGHDDFVQEPGYEEQ